MRSVAVINQKGGVGKTTLTANLSVGLARAGKKVTVIDMDPQGQLGASLGEYDHRAAGIDQVLLNGQSVRDVSREIRPNCQLISAGPTLSALEGNRNNGRELTQRMRSQVQNELADQDFVLIDCPPSSGLLIANALYSVDEVLVPVNGDYLALSGLSYLMSTLKQFETVMQRQFTRWIALNRFVPRRKLAQEVKEKLLGYFPSNVLQTEVREAVALAECPGVGRTIFEYKGSSASAAEFTQLADDLISKRTM